VKYPKGGKGAYARFARWLFEIYKNPWVQYGLTPVLLAVPPAAVTTFYGNQIFRTAVLGLVPPVGVFLTEYVIGVIIAAALYPALLLAFAKSIIKRVDSRGLNVEGLLTLLATIDQIVGCKAQRFGKYATNNNTLTRENVFDELAQPLTQIAENVRGICELFNATRTDGRKHSLIRVVLAAITDGKITALPVHYPSDEPVRSGIEALNSPFSGIMTAVKKGKIIVIENIEKELKTPKGKRRFVDVGVQEDNIGSLICYPVHHTETRTIPFVISIHCDEPGYFKEEFVELYQHSLQRFALRLSLEYSYL
jgi:hypothetical protein